MRDELVALAVAARQFLERQLPVFGVGWWSSGVLGALNYSQRRTAEERGWQSLDDLDVAALLRVIDANWDVFKPTARLTYDSRTWLKEAISLRNRLAHEAPGARRDVARDLRDLDTLARLAEALDPDGATTAVLVEARNAAIGQLPVAVVEEPPVVRDAAGLGPGTIVRLAARPDVKGAVTAVWEGGRERRFDVFHDGSLHSYFESQLELEGSSGDSLMSPDGMRAGITASLLLHPASKHLYSFNSGRIDYEPYQFRPVMKLISSDRPRLLIADDVGVGKTIEAGLIIKELQARQPLDSVLVICPKQLVTERKWRDELKRFDEDFVELDSAALRHCIKETRLEGSWPTRYRKAILPYSLLDERLLLGSKDGSRSAPGLLSLSPPVKFDLVIVDEAHHVRNRETWRHRVVQHLLDSAEAAVLISATPIQTGTSDLFNLLQLLRPDIFVGPGEFDRMREPNAHLAYAEAIARAGDDGWQRRALAELQSALATAWGTAVMAADPLTQSTLDLLQLHEPSDASRVHAVRQLQRLNTFSGLLNRTRRRDIGAFTIRNPETVEVDFTPDQAAVHHELLSLCGQILHARQPGMPLEFLLSMLRRQAASCINGLAPFVRDLLSSRLDAEQLSEADVDTEWQGIDELRGIESEIRALAERAARLRDDPKLDALISIVVAKQLMDNNKLLLFSTFRHTLAYLLPRLEQVGVRVGLVHGATPEEERRATRARFAMDRAHPDAIDLLLSSEVGTEGLDNQFCDAIVNYDIPWNPMRLEQRIGRIDRRGQRSDSISIKNIIVRDTIDASIFHRCLDRIGVFRQSLGGSEEILGELTREMRSIADDLSLTMAQRDEKLRQLGDNKLARIQEQAELEQSESSLFGLAVQRLDDDGVAAAASPWLSADLIGHLVSTYLADLGLPRAHEIFANSPAVLRPSKEIREALLRDVRALNLSSSASTRWIDWLQAAPEQGRRLALRADLAQGDVELLSATHPLVRAAATHVGLIEAPREVSLSVQSTALPAGRYPFAVYGWTTLGVADTHDVRIITTGTGQSDVLAALMTSSVLGSLRISESESDRLSESLYEVWSDDRAQHIESTRLQVEARLASLELSNSARVAQLQQQLDAATHENIRRMKTSELRSAKEDFDRRSADLRLATERCDITTTLLYRGLLEVN
jgi:ATP-dependent helicase HepA